MAVDWAADVRKYVASADDAIIAGIVRYCGIALQKRDSSLVSFSDSKETDRVRNNFLKKKLGLTQADSVLDAAIAAVGARMKADKTKNRVTVYYLLAEEFGMLEMFRKATKAKAEKPAGEKPKPAAKLGAKSAKGAKAAAGAAGAAALGLASLGDSGDAAGSSDEASSGASGVAGAVTGAAAAVAGGAAALASGATSAATGAVSGAAKLAGDAGSAVSDAAAGAADLAGKAAGAAADVASDALGAATAGAAAVAGAAGAAVGAAGAVAGGAADAVSAGAAKLTSAASGLIGGGDSKDDDSSGLGWLWWLLLALLAVFLIWWLFCRNGHMDDGKSAAPAVAASATVDAGVGAVDLAAAPAEGTIAIPAGAGVTSELRNGSPVVKVYFDTGKTDVAAAFTATAGGLKAWLESNAGSSLAVSGFNDSTGNAALNAELSKNRAKAVAAALVASGIPEASVAMVKPDNATDASVDGAAARRVEVTVK